jgi:hypothetical protein
VIFRPFAQQKEFLQTTARRSGAFAGKRGGKTEVGAIKSLLHAEQQIGYVNNGIDPYVGIIMAPTHGMLKRLSLMKFLAYSAPFKPRPVGSDVYWGTNNTIIYGISADKPARMEGIKANFVWLDEVFQMKEQVWNEAIARVADTRGSIWATGSLGVQYNNPKAHWAYRRIKTSKDPNTACFEWATADNPHFPREEIEMLRETLDAQTFRQMFELSWDVQGTNLVYEDFSEANITRGYKYDPKLPTYVSVDWGWTHPAAVLFFQYNPATDTVYLFDEIVRSKMTREVMYDEIQRKISKWRIADYFCDIAGKQTREDSGISNVVWFSQPPRNIHFKYRTSEVAHGISLVRSYVKNSRGQVRLYVDEVGCPRTVDEFRNYSYRLVNGQLTEKPMSEGEDAMSALRYFFVNKLDYTLHKESFESLNRSALTGFR